MVITIRQLRILKKSCALTTGWLQLCYVKDCVRFQQQQRLSGIFQCRNHLIMNTHWKKEQRSRTSISFAQRQATRAFYRTHTQHKYTLKLFLSPYMTLLYGSSRGLTRACGHHTHHSSVTHIDIYSDIHRQQETECILKDGWRYQNGWIFGKVTPLRIILQFFPKKNLLKVQNLQS